MPVLTEPSHRIVDFQDLKALPSLLKQAVATRMVSAPPRSLAAVATTPREDEYFVLNGGPRFDARLLAAS